MQTLCGNAARSLAALMCILKVRMLEHDMPARHTGPSSAACIGAQQSLPRVG